MLMMSPPLYQEHNKNEAISLNFKGNLKVLKDG